MSPVIVAVMLVPGSAAPVSDVQLPQAGFDEHDLGVAVQAR